MTAKLNALSERKPNGIPEGPETSLGKLAGSEAEDGCRQRLNSQ